jgi:D-glycero-D-manno-heptose 1,7-bisphosphate phosphatase
MALYPAIFLDRDGVIIENRAQYVRSWEDVEIYPQALSALARIRDTPYKIIIVTNQSGVGRGLIPLETAATINDRLVQEIEKAQGRVDAILMCPHAPDENCACRKPKPGLLLQAAEQIPIDMSRSIMIGDALTDLEAGISAGISCVVLLRTGRGSKQAQLLDASRYYPLQIFDDLTAALATLISVDP